MQLYELIYLISPELNEKEVEEIKDKIEAIITKNGELKNRLSPKRIELAYPINKKKRAFLASIELETESKQIITVEQELKNIPEIFRFLLIKKRKKITLTDDDIAVKLNARKTDQKRKKEIKEEEPKLKEKTDLDKIEKDLDKILDFQSDDEMKAQLNP